MEWILTKQNIASNGTLAQSLPALNSGKEGLNIPAPEISPSDLVSVAPTSGLTPSTAAANDNKNIVRRKLTGYVGFANLPNQWHRKSVRKGFNFNVMVVGMFPPLFRCLVAYILICLR